MRALFDLRTASAQAESPSKPVCSVSTSAAASDGSGRSLSVLDRALRAAVSFIVPPSNVSLRCHQFVMRTYRDYRKVSPTTYARRSGQPRMEHLTVVLRVAPPS